MQLVKLYGVIVAGGQRPANVEPVKSLGADKVIDYTREDFTQARQEYDVIFDAVGKSSFSRCKRALTPRGVYLTTVPSLGIVWQMLTTKLFGRRKAKFTTAGLLQNRGNLDFLVELFSASKLKAVIDRRYPLAQIAEAHRYVDTGRKKGNVVIQVGA